MAVDMSHKIFTGHFDARKFCFTHWANLFFADDDPFIIRGANTFWPVNMKILAEKKQFQISIFVSKKAAVSKKTTLLSENNAGKNAPQKLRQID